LHSLGADPTENTASIVIAQQYLDFWLRILCRGNVLTEPLPNNKVYSGLTISAFRCHVTLCFCYYIKTIELDFTLARKVIFSLVQHKSSEFLFKKHLKSYLNWIGNVEQKQQSKSKTMFHVCRGADKSLAFPISYFPICSTAKRIFLVWVKEVRTTKS
jgi:hypothetical protein